MSAREEILARIRGALADVPTAERPEDVPVPRAYDTGGGAPPGAPDVVALLAERIADYRATVRVVDEADTPEAVARALAARGAGSVLVPEGFPDAWLNGLAGVSGAGGVRTLTDRPPLSTAELATVNAVLTTAATAIAHTGTFVLDGGPGQGRRALTLIPDYHLCVLRSERVVSGVPQALSRLDPVRPLTFVSGPSATSDIELDRVEGVHGPRTLEVILVR